MKTVMGESRNKYSKIKVNNKFQQFVDDYGFRVRPCMVERPNTKAKVEVPKNKFDEIRSYNVTLDYKDLHKIVSDLNNRINSAYHASTVKIPILHLEKDFLYELKN